MLKRIHPRTLYRENPIKFIFIVLVSGALYVVMLIENQSKQEPFDPFIYSVVLAVGLLLGLIFYRYVAEPLADRFDRLLKKLFREPENNP